MKKIDMYTDGACRGNPDGPGGFGVVMEYRDKAGVLHTRELSGGFSETTNNRMELRAVLEGLKAVNEPCDITVHTDSQYIANAFNQGWLNNWILNGWKRGKKKEPVKNEDLWKAILKAKGDHKLTLVWVRGHAGHPQNERCDVLATAAADSGELTVDIPVE